MQQNYKFKFNEIIKYFLYLIKIQKYENIFVVISYIMDHFNVIVIMKLALRMKSKIRL